MAVFIFCLQIIYYYYLVGYCKQKIRIAVDENEQLKTNIDLLTSQSKLT